MRPWHPHVKHSAIHSGHDGGRDQQTRENYICMFRVYHVYHLSLDLVHGFDSRLIYTASSKTGFVEIWQGRVFIQRHQHENFSRVYCFLLVDINERMEEYLS